MTTRVARGSLWGLGGQGVTLLASLLATPFTIRLLGSEAYGVLALINVLLISAGVADLGMGVASTRFGTEAHAHRGDEGEAAVVWTALLLSLAPALVAALTLIIAAAPLVEQVFRLPAHLRGQAIVALQLASIGCVARIIAGALNTPQLVRLRLDLYTVISSGSLALQVCLVPVALSFGGGLITAVAVIALVSVAAAITHAVVSAKLSPRLLRPRIDSALIGPLARFGGALAVSNLAWIVLANLDKFLLTRLASVTALAHYAVAITLSSLLGLVSVAMGQSLMPAFTRLRAEPDREPLRRLYGRALRGSLLWVAPAALLTCAGAKPFLTLWAGPEFGQESALPLYILVGGAVFDVMSAAAYNLLTAWGRADLIARFHLCELLPYFLLAGLLTYHFGIIGAAVAASLRIITHALLLFLAVRHVSGFTFSPLPANRLSYAAALAVLFLPALLAWQASLSPAGITGIVLASLLAYGGLVWTRVLTGEERTWMESLIPWRGLAGNNT